MVKKNPAYKIIFEGPELAGKSYLMSQVYAYLEPRYNTGGRLLDGCHWLNCDVGVYGGPYGSAAVEKYVEIMELLSERNVMLEKLHISQAVYQKLYQNADYGYEDIEDRLVALGAKLVMTTFDEDESLLKKRIDDRLKLYPHYAKILQKPEDYIRQQHLQLEHAQRSRLPVLIVNSSVLPNEPLVKKIIKFIEEK